MRYIAGTFRYIFKNFIFLFAFVLLPSYFLTASGDPADIRALIDAFVSGGERAEFREVFAFFSPLNDRGWALALVCFATVIVCFPMLFGFIEKHMRLGLRTWKGIAGRFNFNFLTTLVVFVVCIVLYEIWALLTAGLIYAETLLLQGLAASIAALVTGLGMVALLCYVISTFLLWLPCLQITGYNFMDALVYSNSLASQKKSKMFMALWLPCLVSYAARGLLVGFINNGAVVFTITELVYLFLILYICVLMFVVYFDAAGEERMDLKKKF